MRTSTAILIVVCFLLGGAANGVMDTLQSHYGDSIFQNANHQFWHPKISWKNKYKRDEDGTLIFPLRPAFFGSTTFLVWLTDGWHLMKALMMAFFRTALVLCAESCIKLHWEKWVNITYWISVWIGLYLLQAAGFHALYSWILV